MVGDPKNAGLRCLGCQKGSECVRASPHPASSSTIRQSRGSSKPHKRGQCILKNNWAVFISEHAVPGAGDATTRVAPPEVTSAVKEPEIPASYVHSTPGVAKRRTMVFGEILSVAGVFLTFDPLWFWLRQDAASASFCIALRIITELLQLPAVADLVVGLVTVAVMLQRYGPQTTVLPSWQTIRWTGAVLPVFLLVCFLDPEQHGVWFAVCWALMRLLCATYCVYLHRAKQDLQFLAVRGILCGFAFATDYSSTPAAVRSLEFSFKFAALQTLIGPGLGSSYPLFRWMILRHPFDPFAAWDTMAVAVLLTAQQIPALRNGWSAGATVAAPQPTQPPAATSNSWWPSTTRPRTVRWQRLLPGGAWQPLSEGEVSSSAFACLRWLYVRTIDVCVALGKTRPSSVKRLSNER